MTHIILAAENEGLGACLIAAFDPDKLNDVIKPGKGETIYAITP
jgi:nitroreductase